ncbi:MAG: NTP transferase domain-containing protein [Lachnospiraceae bacterium]|nr:NTP transferase domain-containing protein [Lachnospiraceae bacterium]
MKVIILAGGLPSTLIEEDEKMPKPMAEIGGRPILWHIMKQYAHYEYNDFIICTGYKGEVIKEYFMNFYIYQSDITVDLQTNEVEIHRKQTEDWKVSVIDTGRNSSVIERLYMAKDYIEDKTVLVTYGDCLSNIDIQGMVEQHRMQGDIATFAVAHPTGRNEILALNEEGKYEGVMDKTRAKDAWVNACSMVLEPEAFQYFAPEALGGVSTLMECLTREKAVQTYQHEGFWSPIETIRDKTWLEGLWMKEKAPWKVWED